MGSNPSWERERAETKEFSCRDTRERAGQMERGVNIHVVSGGAMRGRARWLSECVAFLKWCATQRASGPREKEREEGRNALYIQRGHDLFIRERERGWARERERVSAGSQIMQHALSARPFYRGGRRNKAKKTCFCSWTEEVNWVHTRQNSNKDGSTRVFLSLHNSVPTDLLRPFESKSISYYSDVKFSRRLPFSTPFIFACKTNLLFVPLSVLLCVTEPIR